MNEASLSTGTRKQKLFFKCVSHDQTPMVIVGSVPELGNWTVSEAVIMHSTPRPQGGYEWAGQAELPLGQTVEFKFLKKTEHGDRWESGNNRRITVIPGLSTLDADFQE